MTPTGIKTGKYCVKTTYTEEIRNVVDLWILNYYLNFRK